MDTYIRVRVHFSHVEPFMLHYSLISFLFNTTFSKNLVNFTISNDIQPKDFIWSSRSEPSRPQLSHLNLYKINYEKSSRRPQSGDTEFINL